MARFQDPAQREEIVERARQLALDAHTYRHRIAEIVELTSGS